MQPGLIEVGLKYQPFVKARRRLVVPDSLNSQVRVAPESRRLGT
jgi:hypothetical protein